MGDVYTGADSIRLYLTGAASDGAAQADPNLSLGKYRSSSLATTLGVAVAGGPANITVDYVSGACGEGDHSISSETTGSLAFTPAGGSKGTAVTIANGETKVLVAGGSEPAKYCVVTRTSATNLSGTATVTTAYQFNNVVGFDNVSTAEQAAGDSEYRCLAAKNVSAATTNGLLIWLSTLGTPRTVNATGYAASGAVTVTITSGDVDDWPESGAVLNSDTGEVLYYSSRSSSALTVPAGGRDIWTDVAGGAAGSSGDALVPIPMIRLGAEAPASQPDGAFTDKTSAGEGSAPAGVTFVHPIASDDADVVDIGSLSAGNIYGLWIERIVIAGAAATASATNSIDFTFEAL